MKNKAKFLAIAVVLVIAVVAVAIVGCSGGSPADLAKNTNDLFTASNNVTAVDAVTLSNVKVEIPKGGLGLGNEPLVSVSSMKIVAERKLTDGKNIDLKLTVSDITDIKLSSLIGTVLGIAGLNIDLNTLKANAHKIKIEFIIKYRPDSEDKALSAVFNGVNLSEIVADVVEDENGNSNPAGAELFAVSKADLANESALIAGIIDIINNPIYGPADLSKASSKDSKITGNITPNLGSFINLATTAMNKFGDQKLGDTETTIKSILNSIFATTDLPSIINGAFELPNFAFSATTAKSGNKNYFNTLNITSSGILVQLTEAQVKGLSTALPGLMKAFNVDISAFEGVIGNVLKGEITVNLDATVSSTYTIA